MILATIYSFILILTCFLFLYLVSRFKKDNSIVDIFWGLGFAIVAVFSFIKFSDFWLIKAIFNAMIVLWGVRLALHIFIKNKGKPEDFRYKKWREEWGKTEPIRAFFQVYLLQALFMFVMSLVIIHVNQSKTFVFHHNYFLIAGATIFIVGFLIETIADYQKSVFKKKYPSGKIMKSGLWKYSRHPNYFGEVVVWLGIFIYSISFGSFWYGLLTFSIIFYLIRFVSGVPMLEKAKKDNEAYQQYAKETPLFFPFLK